ncbi:MAG: NADH-dependent [FeFe] hydrogenase, group A6 [Eubacteriales bacterium]|nr:NADH-dependent [FeFe] hydrogenase, group A6 [Eubacteriales bacterium]MDD4106142.1 NADH-dependent [FeFe] hydrogenase, group A6 [Eubacteriales bacterium]MDD4711231.1 NADH-dependent [FeFe] hydrogenase, group A6 [Eubacteriales bacterium]
MIKLTIDGLPVEVEEGATLLEAATKLDIHIPTLCYHPDQNVKANCRICLVEMEGNKLLVPSCSYPAQNGMSIRTHSPKVRRARRNILELILARHAQDCLHCDRSGTCELQSVSEEMHFVKIPRYPYVARSAESDHSSPSVARDSAKCITCGRCEYVCSEVQTVHALSKTGRGFEMQFRPVYNRPLGESICVNCGQCVQACPTGALTVRDETQVVWHAFADPNKTVIAQVAPAVRITLAEALGEPPGSISTGRMITAMKRVGFHKVFDTDFTADLTILEEGTELISRISNGGALPMITSCCPAWIKFCETFYPELLPHLSTCKSPQQMFGALLKTYYAEKTGKLPQDILSVSVMPCTAKKYEETRPELGRNGIRDIDAVVSVQELARMIRSAGIRFDTLPDTPFDAPFGLGTGAGEIFGSTGGVMEAALRTVYELVTGKPLQNIDIQAVRGFEGIKEAAVDMNGTHVKVAVANGLSNARKIMELVKAGKTDYHFIEIMACPGGCIGGGGNPIKENAMMRSRLDAVYRLDKELPIRKSHENLAVKALYEEYLGEPNGHRSHALLHTTYMNRSGLLG